MDRDLIIRPEAEVDITKAFNWYEEHVPGLGTDYLQMMEAAFYGITRNPEACPIIYQSTRRCLIRRFPYAIFYLIEPSRIIVLSVFHVRQNPDQWKKRG